MIISHRHKFVCLNPPRTGTGYREITLKDVADLNFPDIEEKLKSFAESNDFVNPKTFHGAMRHIYNRHANYEEMKKYFDGMGWNLKNYYKFTFIRNPIDRIISFHNFHISENGLDFDAHHFVKYADSLTMGKTSQDAYLSDDLNYVGKMENMMDDLNAITKEIGCPLNLTECKKDRDTHKDYDSQKWRDALSERRAENIPYIEKFYEQESQTFKLYDERG